MKLGKLIGPCVVVVMLLGLDSAAQEGGEDTSPARTQPANQGNVEEEEARGIRYLPKPFSDIRTNILDLERSGYFAVESVAFRTRLSGDEAIVWQVRVKKTITCRHIEALLREFRDVRIYSTIEQQRLEVLATLMFYSDRVALGASNNRLLREDDVFELWVDLSITEQQKLISLHADTLVLRRWKH